MQSDEVLDQHISDLNAPPAYKKEHRKGIFFTNGLFLLFKAMKSEQKQHLCLLKGGRTKCTH
eukprot:3542356-Amphidinium_carterae.1